jgi:hypothetical protein
MKTLLLLIAYGAIPYYHVPQWFDTKMSGKCTMFEGAKSCYFASEDTSGRKMIGVRYRQCFPNEFDSLFKVWNDTTVYYLGIEDFVR